MHCGVLHHAKYRPDWYIGSTFGDLLHLIIT